MKDGRLRARKHTIGDSKNIETERPRETGTRAEMRI